jgi:transposase-like protein
MYGESDLGGGHVSETNPTYNATSVHPTIQRCKDGNEDANMNPMKGISTRQHWHCPSCGVSVTTFVTPVEPPSHPCPKKANRITSLQQQEKEK